MRKRKAIKICVLIAMLVFAIAMSKLFSKVSYGVDNDEKAILEGALDKYVNYELRDGTTGTLVQYSFRTGIKYGEEFFAIKNSELNVSLNQIDGKYPYDVRVIGKSTKATNGKTSSIEEDYNYDSNTGLVTIRTSNENENGEPIYNTRPEENDRDEFVVIAYYDTYTKEEPERDLSCNATYKAILFTEDNREVIGQGVLDQKVTEDVGDLTSVDTTRDDIYNGYIKSNIINGTTYDTEYTENNEIMISKKEAHQKINITEENTFVNPNDIYYKSTKILKEDFLNVLGENGKIEIFDGDNNLISTIDNNTGFNENGEALIVYPENVNKITIKTSDIINEGILHVENVKKIKSDVLNIDDKDIVTKLSIIGINDKEVEKEDEDGKITTEIVEEESYRNDKENTIEVKDSTTNVGVNVDNTNWTNEKQNDVTFDISLNSSSISNNLFSNPTIRIKLPSEVEKVILNNSSIMYANGLSMQEPYLETAEDGSTNIVIKLDGTQTTYSENNLGLITNIKLSASIILKNDIETKLGKVTIDYTNNYTVDGGSEQGNIEKAISMENFQENQATTSQDTQNSKENTNDIISTVTEAVEEKAKAEVLAATQDEIDGLQVTVTPVKGDTELKDGDTVYEGEFIKYNIKVTNTTSSNIDNVKVVGTIPEGTTYGELETKFDSLDDRVYRYNFDDSLREKEINIGTVRVGQTVEQYYEVRVNNLQDNEEEKTISTNIKAYIGDTQSYNYDLNNIIQQAEASVYLTSQVEGVAGEWSYTMNVNIPDGVESTIRLNLDEFFSIKQEYVDNQNVYINASDSEGESISDFTWEFNGTEVVINTNKSGTYFLGVQEGDKTQLIDRVVDGKVELKAVASVTVNDVTYKSNENRLDYALDDIYITMASDNEGQEVRYGEEINYNISISAFGRKVNEPGEVNGIYVNLSDYLPENVIPESVTYDYYEPVFSEVVGEDGPVEQITGLSEKQEKTEDITLRSDENGNRLPEVDIYTYVPYNETVNVTIKTTAGYVYERTEIQNSAIVKYSIDSDRQTVSLTKTSNIVKHIILPGNIDEGGGSDTPEEPTDPENPDNPNNPEDPNNPENPGDPNARYNISGLAWNDENGDGARQDSESLISGIEVLLVNLNDSSNVAAETTTNNGRYTFSNLAQGNYIVVFTYNTSIYRLTEYRKSGVAESVNSDAASQKITLDGREVNAGVTDVINLNREQTNIDIGLIQNDACDLKLDKYITDISVTTKSGTKQYSYDNTKLGRVEIRAKEINGAQVSVTYRIVVTNEGKTPATVREIYDYLPDGLSFSSNGNANWTNQSGVLINRSLMNQEIAAGESKEIYLTLTKTMGEEDTGTFTNAAEIGSVDNTLGIQDNDSTPGNRNSSEDDYSEAQLIISVSTGLVMYISIVTIVLILVALLALAIKFRVKIRKISKIGMFLIMFAVIGIVSSNDVFGYNFHYISYYQHKFQGGPTGTAYCSNHDGTAAGWHHDVVDYPARLSSHCYDSESAYTFDYNSGSTTYGSTEITSPGIQLSKTNNEIGVRKIGNNYVLGPFGTSSNSSENYSVAVYDKAGTVIDGWVACDANGNAWSSVPGNSTFYLSLSPSLYGRGVSRVTVTQNKTKTYRTYRYTYGRKYFYYSGQNPCYDSYNQWHWAQGPKPHQGVYTTEYKFDEGYDYGSEVTTATIEWTNFNATLDIIKVDDDDPNVKLDIQGTLAKNDGTFSQNFTTTDGTYHFDNLTPGAYTLTETVNNNYGYEHEVNKQVQVTVTGGTVQELSITNQKQTGNLRIVKKDQDSNTVLEDVSFKIMDSSGKYIIAIDENGESLTSAKGTIYLSNMQTTDDESQATEFITDSNGEIKIYNIRTGTYTVREISVGDNNYGYEVDDNYISWNNGQADGTGASATMTVSRQTSDNTSNSSNNAYDILTFNNRRKWIKLSGKVWEDMISGKTSERDSLYNAAEDDESNPDRLVANVTVRLKDRNENYIQFRTEEGGELVSEVLTSSNEENYGTYQMVDVLIDELQNYYIEFSYNGMSYTSVPIVDILLGNGTKAIENTDVRAEFNRKYSEITHQGVTDPIGQSNDDTGSKTYDLNYDEGDRTQGNYNSTLNYGPNSKDSDAYGYEGQNFPVNPNKIDEQYVITSTTRDAFLSVADGNNNYSGYLSDIKSAEQIREENITEITDINLGLREREQPDLALVQDIDNAKVTLNGYEHTYYYNQRFANQEVPEGFDVGVKFGNEYGSANYTQTIYSSDVVYNEQTGGENGVLGVYVTYKVALRNEATNLYTRVNEVVNYFDNRYDTNNIMVTDEDGNVLSYAVDPNYDNNGFRKMTIQANQNIVHENQRAIYITYKLQNDAVNAVLNGNLTLDSVSEITSYSTYSDENFSIHYAGVDKDSRPGSAIPENRNNENDDTNKETYEDDTDKAPSFILQISESEGRVIRGTVWEDNAIEELLNNTGYEKERKGDGIYVNGENVVEQVKVELLACDESGNPTNVASLYKKDQVQAGNVVEEPESATTNTDQSGNYEFSGIIPGKYVIRFTYGNSSVIVKPDGTTENLEAEKYKSTIYRGGNKEQADAMNDYWYRAETGEGTTRLSDARDISGIRTDGTTIDDIVEYRTREEQTYNYGTIQKENSPALESIEANTRLFDIKLDYDINLDNISQYGEQLKFVFDNMDLGIIRRPIQNLDVRKEIAYVQVKLANGQVVIEGDPREGNINHLRFLPDGNIHIELDSELLQGATLTIRYEIIVDNRNAEIDYNDNDYYIYGIVPQNNANWKLATISSIFDYLSNGLVYNENNVDNQNNWTQITDITKEEMVDQGLLSEDAFNAVKQYNQILQTTAFSNMEPNQELRVPLEVSRVLSNNSDDFIFENDMEVNEVKNRKMEHDGDYTTPGDYVPSETGRVPGGDDDYVYLTVTGPTGENQNYIPYIILGISSFIILGAGIIFIKKKVLG